MKLIMENWKPFLTEQQDYISSKNVGTELIRIIKKEASGKINSADASKIFNDIIDILTPKGAGQPIGISRKHLISTVKRAISVIKK